MAKPVVQDPDTMSDEVMIKHMNHRHVPIAGLAKFVDYMSPGVIATVRGYHDHVHRVGREDRDPVRMLDHSHVRP